MEQDEVIWVHGAHICPPASTGATKHSLLAPCYSVYRIAAPNLFSSSFSLHHYTTQVSFFQIQLSAIFVAELNAA